MPADSESVRIPGAAGFRDWLIRRFFRTDRLPAPLLYAHLAAIFARLGHRVEYAEDRLPRGADLYVFCPSLITLQLEQQAIARVRQQQPSARVLVVGLVASVMPEAFDGLGATVVKGEAEQLLWKLDEVLSYPGAAVQLGLIEDLDRLPPPDWSPLRPRRFRVGYDFWRFPTALVQASRGCAFDVQLLPVHRPGTRRAAPQPGGRGRGDPPRRAHVRLPLVQVPRPALRRRRRAVVPAGRPARPPAAADPVLDRDAQSN